MKQLQRRLPPLHKLYLKTSTRFTYNAVRGVTPKLPLFRQLCEGSARGNPLLWYGYIYYLFFFLTLFLGTNFLLRLFLVQFFFQTNALNDYTKVFVPTLLAFFFVTFTTLYLTFDYYISTTTLWLAADLKSTCFAYGQTLALFDLCHLQLNYTEVYFFPFIYIFFLITTISILFCLAYNLSETISFFFYTTLILVAGYVLFFTDSLLLFFLSYELLLIPSFLILYNFAKTRRCVEAAYLMFF